ncbi:MAG: DNA polymerase III subunit delta [Pirellulales bacterium]|nr:DNA polymerase III subunit delta [Pirellulales bacterium]
MAKSKALHALDYLKSVSKYPARPVCVVYGDEPFLIRHAAIALERSILGDSSGDADMASIEFDGKTAELREVLDELATPSLFGGGPRLVKVEQADDFVTRNRAKLEDYVDKPISTGVLLLEVTKWPSNTRLYKAIDKTGLQIECKSPTEGRLSKWLVDWGKRQYGVTVDSAAAEVLLELSEPEMGLLDQELSKVASAAGDGGTVTPELVEELVGSWRTKSAWDMLDAAAAGNAPDALLQLDRLLTAGENPIAVLAQIAASLRRFAAATQLIEKSEVTGRRIALRQALESAGFKPFVIRKAEPQLRQIGRHRGAKLYGWLLEADLALKGASSSPERSRLVLEKLIVRLSRAAAPFNGGPKAEAAIV